MSSSMSTPEPRVEVRLKVSPHGRAPANYGATAYKFAAQAARLLLARNWREVGRGAKYAYLAPQQAEVAEPPFAIDVSIPTQPDVLALAEQLHEAGKKWIGRWGEWDAGYRPANNEEFVWTDQGVDPYTAKRIGSPVRHSSRYNIEPLFIVGSPGLWSATVRWINGNATYTDERQNIVTPRPTLFERSDISSPVVEEAHPDDFYEGALHRTTTNRYERDPCAK